MPSVTDADPLRVLMGALKSLVRWLEATQVRGVIIGGVANTFLGRPRLTRDVDGMVWLGDDTRTADFIAQAAPFGIVPRIDDAVAFARVNRVMLLTHPASAIDIDVSSGCLPFEEELLDRAQVDSSLGFDVPLPTAEDLIVMKLLPSRPHDLRDIEGIMDAHPNLDVARIRLWAQRFADAAEMPEIVETLERLLSHRERVGFHTSGMVSARPVRKDHGKSATVKKRIGGVTKSPAKSPSKKKTPQSKSPSKTAPPAGKKTTAKKTAKKNVSTPAKKTTGTKTPRQR